MSNSELVQLAKDLRAAGVTRLKHGDIELEFLPPAPPKLTELSEQLRELPLSDREELMKQTKRDLDEDLYGASL